MTMLTANQVIEMRDRAKRFPPAGSLISGILRPRNIDDENAITCTYANERHPVRRLLALLNVKVKR